MLESNNAWKEFFVAKLLRTEKIWLLQDLQKLLQNFSMLHCIVTEITTPNIYIICVYIFSDVYRV